MPESTRSCHVLQELPYLCTCSSLPISTPILGGLASPHCGLCDPGKEIAFVIHSLLNKYNCAAAVLFLLHMCLVGQDTGLVFLDFGGDAFDEFLNDGKLVRVRSDDGDDVDF
jgi:hypothetical protein